MTSPADRPLCASHQGQWVCFCFRPTGAGSSQRKPDQWGRRSPGQADHAAFGDHSEFGAGSSLIRVVKTTIFLTNLADFAAVNEIYGQFFSFEPPARSTVQVAALPKGAKVEIEAIATCPREQAQTSSAMF